MYETFDQTLAQGPPERDTRFFAGAATATSEAGVGAVDRIWSHPFLSEETRGFLRETNEYLFEKVNVPAFNAIVSGDDRGELRGKTGLERDLAFVQLEQSYVSKKLAELNPETRRVVAHEVNRMFHASIVLEPFGVSTIAEALREDFPEGNFNFVSHADRVRLGSGILARIREQ